jgi:hypothetical protein
MALLARAGRAGLHPMPPFCIGYQLSDLRYYRATLPANPATACAIVFR